VIGISILVVAIISYIYLAYIVPDNEVMDDSIGWFHRHVIKILVKNGGYSDQHLWFPEKLDLLRTPILVDKLVIMLGLMDNPGLLTIVSGIFLAIASYIIGYTIFREPIAAGIGSLIAILTPATLYWFRVNMFGSYIAGLFGIATLLAIGYALRRNSKVLTIVSAILFTTSWLLWGSAWFIQIIYSLYIIALIYSGRITRHSLVIGLLLILFSIPINIIGVSRYVTVYHVFSTVFLLVSLVLAYVEYRIVKGFKEPIKRNIWRFLGVFIPFALSISITLTINQVVELPGIPEHCLKTYKPISDYMAIAVLAPFSIVLFLRAGYFSEIERSFVEFLAIAGFMTGIIAAFIDPSLTVYSTILIAPVIAYGLERLATVTLRSVKTRWKYLYFAATLWIIASAVLANAYSSYNISSSKPSVYYGPASRELVESPPNSSALLDILQYIDNGSLVIVDPMKSYWIIGSKDVYVLADPNAPIENRRLLAQILVSNEYLSLGLINNLARKYGVKDVYIVLGEMISVEKPVVGVIGSAHIGRPLVATTREGLRQAYFLPVDDSSRFIEYLNLANYSVSRYIDREKAIYNFQLPLAWTEEAKKTVLVKLLVTAVERLGYTVVNDVYSRAAIALMEDEKPKYIEFINASTIYLYSIETDVTTYNVYYMVAVFKVDLEAFSGEQS